MISPPVPTEHDIKGRLHELGFKETASRTATGIFWEHEITNQHLLVPDSLDGMYPDWLFNRMLLTAEDISGKSVKSWPGWLPRPDITA